MQRTPAADHYYLFFKDHSVASGLRLSARLNNSVEVQLNTLNMKALQSLQRLTSACLFLRCCFVVRKSAILGTKASDLKEK